jgi:hypothetical protein
MALVTLSRKATLPEIEQQLEAKLDDSYDVYISGGSLWVREHALAGCRVSLREMAGNFTEVVLTSTPPSPALNAALHLSSLLLALGLSMVGLWYVGIICMVLSIVIRYLLCHAVTSCVRRALETCSALDSVIRFTCSSCGNELQSRAETAGKKAKCPKCLKVLRIPLLD